MAPQVTLVEFLDRMVPLEDEEFSAELARRHRRMGIDILTSTRVESIVETGDGVQVHTSMDGQRQTLHADKCPPKRVHHGDPGAQAPDGG